jgi:hypothetical protein
VARPRSREGSSLRPPAAAGLTPLTFGGETAYYTDDELAEMRTLPSTPEGEHVGRLIHEGKVHGDATLLRTSG